MESISAFFVPGLIFLLTLVSGVWLSHSGKPLNDGVFAIHKLIALGGVITLTLQLFNAFYDTGSQSPILALILLAGGCVAALFATGARMSLGSLGYAIMHMLHTLVTVGLVVVLAITLYLLAGIGS